MCMLFLLFILCLFGLYTENKIIDIFFVCGCEGYK